MSMRKKQQLFLIAGVGAAVLAAAVILILVLSGRSGKKEDMKSFLRHYEAAEQAFLDGDYDDALSRLEQAREFGENEKYYLLLADIYCAKGDTDRAVRELLRGDSNVGGEAIAAKLKRLQGEDAAPTPTADNGSVTLAGRSYGADTSSVVLSGKNLEDGDFETLCGLTELENLSVSDNNISNIGPITRLKKLTTLQISNNRIRDLSPLAELGQLKTLYLDGNPVDDLTPLYKLTSLRTISMKNVVVTPEQLSALAEALPDCYISSDQDKNAPTQITLGGRTFSSDVTELNLGGLGLTDISALSACKDLKKLDLRDNGIRDLSPLSELRELEKLVLWNNKVEDLTPLMSLSRLRQLDLENNDLTGITPLEFLTGLEELWLNGNELSSFKPLETLTGLRRLGLKETGIEDGDLSRLYKLDALQELNLEGNEGLTGKAVEELEKELPRCQITHDELLWELKLGGKTYTSDETGIVAHDSGVTSLEGIEKFTELRTLDLDGNDLRDLSPLYGLKKLERVTLRDNPNLSQEEVEALREKLPDCEILADEPEPEPTEEPEPSESPEPTTAPDPELGPDPAYTALGAGAAVEARKLGDACGILWLRNDPVGEAVKEGFISGAVEQGMTTVYTYELVNRSSFETVLEALRNAGVEVVCVALEDEEFQALVETARAMGYEPLFVQVYP